MRYAQETPTVATRPAALCQCNPALTLTTSLHQGKGLKSEGLKGHDRTGPGAASDLDEAVDAAGDEGGAIGREARGLGVGLLPELEGAVQLRGEALHLIVRALRLAPEQVEGRARRQQPLCLLPGRPLTGELSVRPSVVHR